MQRRMGRTWAGRLSVVAGASTLAAVLMACSGGGSEAEPPLSATAAQGKQLAVSKGCASCHVFYGRDAAGPTWKGVYGSEVELTDGRVVVADEAYLTRAIEDPWAEKVKGFGTIMPRNNLTEDQVALIVAYIKELNPQGS